MSKQFFCPVCKMALAEFFPENKKAGLFCGNSRCPSNEQPFGVGRTIEAAYNILVTKYGRGTDAKLEDVKEEAEETPKAEETIVNKEIISYE